MVIVKLSGALGNQMFQYAAGLGLAARLKTNLYIDTDWYAQQKALGVRAIRRFDLNVFGIEPRPIAKIDKISAWLNPPQIFSEPAEEYITYQQKIAGLKNNVILDGYWQSYKYFEGYAPQVLKSFTFPTKTSTRNKQLLKLITESNSVSIHIRRGDYASDEQTRKKYGLLPIAYYKEAMSIISSELDKPAYFVISDDIAWCREKLNLGSSATFVDNNNGSKDYEDMRLMSNCKHNIIANSSYSWWGAWLNQNPHKKVVAPTHWTASEQQSTKDLIPKTWQKI